MTLATIAADVFDEVQVGRESTIVGNTRTGARRLLRYANSIGKQLIRDYNWQALRREHTFTAAASQAQSGALPSDFLRLIPDTFYDRTNDGLLIGPITPAEWQMLTTYNYQGSGTFERRFIYRNGSIQVIPAFDGGESCALEYITDLWCEDSGGTGKTEFTADTDIARIDEELLTLAIASAWLQGEGLPAAHIEKRYMDRLRSLMRQDQAKRGGLVAGDIFGPGVTRHWSGIPTASGSSGGIYWLY